MSEKCVNNGLAAAIVQSFNRILQDISKHSNKDIRRVALISLAYPEDWYNTELLMKLLAAERSDLTFVHAEMNQITSRDGQLYVGDIAADAVYRYYPLDWFIEDDRLEGVLKTFMDGTPSINPPHTIICQSKAFFALIWELMGKGFYTNAEEELIRKYIPRTALSAELAGTRDYVQKPLLGREGEGVHFWLEGDKDDSLLSADQSACVFQERVDVQQFRLKLYQAGSVVPESLPMHPVIGAFITGESFAGIYTRCGSWKTDRWSVYLPAYLCKADENASD